jgi:hypothetical protein
MHKKPKRQPTGDYPVGFAAPPVEHRFQKGKSGNLSGRPKAARQLLPEEVEALLASGITVQKNGAAVKMHPYEVELRKLVQKALHDGDLKSIDRLLKKFKQHGLLPEAPLHKSGGVVTLPRIDGIPQEMAKLLMTTYGAPPWSAQEIEAIRPVYEEAETEYWAMKKESLRAIYRGMQRGKYDQ